MRTTLVFLCLLGCGRGGLDRSAFDLDVCAQGRWSELAATSPADPGGYLALVATEASPPSRAVVSSTGSRCTTAADRPGCEAAIDGASPSGAAWTQSTCSGAGCRTIVRFFVEEKAGRVRVLEDVTALTARLLPIDTAAEAALLAVYAVKLDGMDCSAPQVRRLPDGAFQVFLGSGDGECTDRDERLVRVGADGAVSTEVAMVRQAAKTCLSP